jgi:hypothetical protein
MSKTGDVSRIKNDINVCFTCNTVGDIKKCMAITCFAYSERVNVMCMDDNLNQMISAQAKRINHNVRLGG